MANDVVTLRFLVVGCGSIGKRHIANLLALGASDLIAYDIRSDRRTQVQTRFSIPAVTDLEAAWERQPNVAVIAAPTSLHIPLALAAAEHGCHLFIEKPLSHNLEDVDRLLQLVREKGLVTLVGCNMRFHPAIRKVKELIDGGAIGRPLVARVEAGQYLPDWHPWEDYRQGYSAQQDLGGGVLLDSVHELEYIRHMLGEVEKVACFGGKLSHLEIETEDTAAVLLRFASGAIGELHMDYVQRAYSRSCHVIGEEGTVRWDYSTGDVRLYSAAASHWTIYAASQGWQPNQMYLDEMAHLLRCLEGTENSVSDVFEAKRVLQIALAAKESMSSEHVVDLPPMPSPRKPKVVAITQARMGSTRLPGKVFADISGRPMLWHVVNRLRRVEAVDEVVVATSRQPADDVIAAFCAQEGISCYRGSESDVLDRYYQSARLHGADVIVRITADCPLIDPQIVNRVVYAFLNGSYDYVSNTLQPTYPDGLDAEVFSLASLEKAWQEAALPTEREHVTPYLRASGKFRVRNVENDTNHYAPGMRLTVDEPADLDFVRAVYSRLWDGHGVFHFSDILQLMQREPQLMELNANIIANEGYYKSLVKEQGLPPQPRRLDASRELKRRAERLIPSCTQTFSKGPSQFVQGVAPIFLARGSGSHVWDVDGNEYIDYPMALGAIILGHDYPAVREAVTRELFNGTSFTLPHPLEVELAEVLCEVIPCAEMVRFGKNGSDATSGAVRVARAYTGRDVIACCGYHGWQDWYIGTTTRNKGVPQAVRELTVPFVYNDLESLERIFAEHPGKVAAVIMEPVGVIEPKDNFLQLVKELAHREGALLIYDEIVSGFRFALGGAQQYFGVVPDLACVGKAMGNGFPISAVVGRREVMEMFDEIFFSFTFGGETVSLAAAVATVEEMRRKNVISHLWAQGRKLADGYNVLARSFDTQDFTECIGLAPRTVITFKDETGAESLLLKSLFQQECVKRQVLFSGGQNLCYGHSDGDIDRTLRVYRAAMEIMADAIRKGDAAARLEGPPVQAVFRRA